MSISFNQIPINLLTPGQYVEVDNSKAVGGLVNETARILLFAPKLSSAEKSCLRLRLTPAVTGQGISCGCVLRCPL